MNPRHLTKSYEEIIDLLALTYLMIEDGVSISVLLVMIDCSLMNVCDIERSIHHIELRLGWK